MASLAEIRAKLKEQESRGTGERTGGDNSIYPFWKKFCGILKLYNISG